MTNNYEYKSFELLPNVRIYQGLLPDAYNLYDIMNRSEKTSEGKYYLRKWDEWSIFGTYSQQKHDPNEPRELGPMYDEEKHLSDRVYEAYNTAIEDYIKIYNITLPPTSKLMTSSFSKYNSNINTMGNELTMQYHTDYIISEKDMPGPKFFLTCTTYINDDYEGGDIEFWVGDKFFPYKPKAGDILVFPSGDPYFHGVRTIRNGEKFFIRNFIQHYYPGSQEWLSNQMHHGAYRWSKMEWDRIEKENPKNMKYADRKNLGYQS
jgi:hypothetical protein